MMRSDQEDDFDYEDSDRDSEEESDETSVSSEDDEDIGFVGSRYAAVDQIMREAAGSSTDRAGGRLERAVTWPAGQVVGRSALRRSSEPSEPKSVRFAVELAETQEFPVVFSWSDSDSDSSPANPHRNMLEQMDINPEALAKAEAAVFSSSRSPVTATETESPEEVHDATDALSCGESERVEPIQESENQLPGLDESVVDMAPEATGADEVGALQESSSFATTVAELGVQRHCAEDEDVPEPEHELADGASVSVLEEDEEDERCGSDADVEDPVEALGHVSPESESDLGASGIAGFATLGAIDMEATWRAACADGAPGQHSDSDVQTETSLAETAIQQPTREEAVKEMSCKKQIAANMEERWKLEGLLLQPPEADDGTPAAEDSWSWLSWIMAHMCCGPRTCSSKAG